MTSALPPPTIGLPPGLFADAFPFHFVFDRTLTLRQMGKGLGRIAPSFAPGSLLPRLLSIETPTLPLTFDTIKAHSAQLFILRLATNNTRLRGQMVYLAQDDLIVFLGSPWLNNTKDLIQLGLTLSDFALHDPVLEILQVMQVQSMVTTDLRKVTERLSAQRAELRAANADLRDEVAKRLHAAEELETQRDFAQQVMNTMGQGLTVTDADGCFTYVNPAFAELTGHRAEQLIGASARTVIVEGDWPLLAPAPGDGTSRSQVGEVRLIKADGSRRFVLMTSVPRWRDGRYLGMIAVMTDLDERKRVEEEMEIARDRALEASRIKSDFLANMSHEIRTPLNGISGIAELLGDTSLTSRQHEMLGILTTSAHTLLALVNDILDFSKIEAGKISINLQPFDLRQCLESCLDVVATAAQRKGLGLGYLLKLPAPTAVCGDKDHLSQILINLLSNAVKFTDRGEVSLIVTPQQHPDRPDAFEFHFAVRDTGMGIPLDRQSDLFQSFSQIDGSTTRKYGGTGLGLAISRRLCELMGGRIWLESTGIPGSGSTFHFVTPMDSLSGEQKQSGPAPMPFRDKTAILLMDRSSGHTQWRNLALLAEQWGMEVWLGDSIKEALTFHQSTKPADVIVTEDRIHAATKSDSDDAWPAPWANMPVVLLKEMGQADRESADLSTYPVVKPVKAESYFQALEKALTSTTNVAAKRQRLTAPTGEKLADQFPLRILVVEDQLANQVVIRRMLELFGYTAEIAGSGKDALAAIQATDYDLVLMDMRMPEMDGLETTQRLRTLEQTTRPNRRVRIVALTANASVEDRRACLAAGMDDYISKPIRLSELRRMFEEMHESYNQPPQRTNESQKNQP